MVTDFKAIDGEGRFLLVIDQFWSICCLGSGLNSHGQFEMQERQILQFIWNNILLEVRYSPSWISADRNEGDHATAHLEIESMVPPGFPLPITDTGYRSSFCSAAQIQEAGGPGRFVQRWLDLAAKARNWRSPRQDVRQLSFF